MLRYSEEEIYLIRRTLDFHPAGWVKNWFSNMMPLDEPFEEDGVKYFTSENYYQAAKIEDHRRDLRVAIAAMDAHASKLCFRKDPDRFKVRDGWNAAQKLATMRKILRFKFGEGTSWHNQLINCEGDIIEWNNWGDDFWGVDLRKGEGQNHLGRILEKIREDFVRPSLDDFLA